jgi:hypothetical protein
VSRWIEAFEAHDFQNSWLFVKSLLQSTSIDDETVITSVNELARLNKVVAFIDEIVNGIDPELVPMQTWDNFNKQAATCAQQVELYNSNRIIGHLISANTHADNLLTYVRPYMITGGKIGQALQKSIKEYTKIVDQHGDILVNKSQTLVHDIGQLAAKSKDLYASIENTNSAAERLSQDLLGDGDSNKGMKGRLQDIAQESEDLYAQINEFYNVTLVGDEDAPSTRKEISLVKTEIISVKDEIQEQIRSITTEVSELEQFHIKTFGAPNENGERQGGIAAELTQKNIKYNALIDQIETLLPGATSAGLATAYRDMKKSFDDPIKYSSIAFYASVGLLVIAAMFITVESVGGSTWVKFAPLGDWDHVLRGLVAKLPFYGPVLWLAFFASKRRSEYQRLQQEYAHKEALAKSYDSYKKQIQELDDQDSVMQKEFIMKAIDAIAYNASQTLDGKHGDKMPVQEFAEKVIDYLNKANLFTRGNKAN